MESAFADLTHSSLNFAHSVSRELGEAASNFTAAVARDAKSGTIRKVIDDSKAVSIAVGKKAEVLVNEGQVSDAEAKTITAPFAWTQIASLRDTKRRLLTAKQFE